MDLAELKKIITLVEKSEIQELELEEEGCRIRIRKGLPDNPGSSPAPAVVSVPAAASPAPEAVTAPSVGAHPPVEKAAPEQAEGTAGIVAPMIGTFYRAPAPEAPPYVQVGDRVNPDTVVCIIEAMKVMNEIKAGLSGRVVDVVVENARPVEFGQPLFRVATD